LRQRVRALLRSHNGSLAELEVVFSERLPEPHN
jgi:hypothetical protein